MKNINNWRKANYYHRLKNRIEDLFKVVKEVYNNKSDISIAVKGEKPNDFLTNLDKSIESATRNYLIENEINCSFGSEESNIENLFQREVWEGELIPLYYIDPLDGTGNFVGDAKNLPHCYAVSVVLDRIFSMIEASGVYNFQSDTYWVATRNDELHTNAKNIEQKNVLALDLYQITNKDKAPSKNFWGELNRNKLWPKDFGSSAFHYAEISSGGISAYYNPAQKPEELLAGYLLVKNSGGVTIDVESGSEISNLPIQFSKTYNVISAKSKELAFLIRDIVLND